MQKTFISFLIIVFISGVCSLQAYASFSIPAPLPGENQSINISGSTVKVKGLTNQANTAWINGRETPVQQDGSFYEEVLVPLGQTEILVEVKDPAGRVNRYSKLIQAKENHWFLEGIVD